MSMVVLWAKRTFSALIGVPAALAVCLVLGAAVYGTVVWLAGSLREPHAADPVSTAHLVRT